jgi:Ca2+-binding RTX toxin-like protein
MPINLTDGSGYLWDIQDDGRINNGTNDAYDGGMSLVGFTGNSTPSTEDAGREVVLGTYTSGQVSIARKVYVPNTGTGFARFLEIVTNTGTTSTVYNLGINSNLGSDVSTNVINTSSGDTVFSTADKWIITDDGTNGGGDPAVAHVFAGTGGIAPTSVTQNDDIITYNFSLSLAPGETKIIAHFGVQAANQSDVALAVNYIQSQPSAIFAGMSSQELAQVVNYVTGPVINSTYAIAATAGSVKAEGNTGSTAFTFTVTRTGDTTVAGTVDYAVVGSGTQAASATDFSGNVLPSATVSFAAGETSKTITLNVVGDTSRESDETFTVRLQNATSGTVSTGSSQATGTIINDDLNPLTEGDDQFTGTTGADFVSGLGGDDWLMGREGNDVLVGGGGDDRLDGGSSNDLLAGGSGDDTLNGGSGNDVLYAGNSPAWSSADDVQTSSASGVIPSTSQTLAISLTAPTATDSGMVTVEGLVSRSTASTNQFNIVYVIDDSGSMSSSFSGAETVADMNGNSVSNELMDAAIKSFESLNASLATNGFANSRLGIVRFSDTASIIYNDVLNGDANSNGLSDAADALRAIQAGGDTYYDLALQQAISFFNAAPSGNNVVFFISDGQPNGGVYTDEVATLLDANGIHATIRAIGLGSGSSLTALDLVDDGLANNTAKRVDSPSALTAGLVAPPVNSADIARVEILKEGVVVATILPSQLVSTPLGLKYSANVSGLNLDDNTLVARVIATDAASTTVSTGLHVGTGEFNDFLYGGADNDLLYGGRGTDLLDGGSGVDTASYELNAQAVTVDLSNTGYQNTIGAGLDQLVSIENLTGSNMNDTLTGNSGNNVINGLVGNDIIDGGAGNDIIDGGAGSDTMIGGAGSDTYYVRDTGDIVTETNAIASTGGTDTVNSYLGAYTLTANVENGRIMNSTAANLTGNSLNNTLFAGAGNNTLNGGAGTDTASYAYATAGVTASLAVTTAQSTGGSGSDTLLNIENLTGGAYNDTLTGNSGANVLDGGAGSDTMIGGDGSDTYYVRDTGDIVTETNAIASTGGTDTVNSYLGAYTLTANVENGRIMNSTAANLTGNSLNNTLFAGAGNNTLNGGAGTDTASYAYATAGVTASLAVTTAQSTGGSGSDTLLNIENLTGGAYNDTLTGNSGANVLDGGAGSDTMIGGDGSDTYYVRDTGDIVTETNAIASTGGTDTVNSYLGAYTLTANVENGRIMNSTAANLTGNSLNNTLFAGAGNNTLNGGAGTDTASYAYATAGVTASLAVTTAQSTGGSGSDTLLNIENLTGGAYNDTLTGNSGANVLDGGAGKDTLTGNGGNDTFDFNALTEMGATITTCDIITDFTSGDMIDLSTLDANTATTTNDAFDSLTVGATFSGVFASVGDLYFDSSAHVLYGNTDADSSAEFAISLTSVTTLSTSNLVL